MSTKPRERLYGLLPSIHRRRDALQGEPLRALLGVIEAELETVEDDITRLYDNWFIETCQEWVIPYIGDLLGLRDLVPVDPNITSQRAYVANALAYRRRKGTATVLEQLARDITSWPARVVEFFQLLGTTQFVNHPRTANLCTPDLRDAGALERVGGPFDTLSRTLDVRHIDVGRGKHGLPNVGIFLWRLEAFPVIRTPAVPATEEEGAPGFFRFSVLGQDVPLFNSPRSETEITHLADESNVPGRLRRRPLHEELEARRAALVRGVSPQEVWFASPAVLSVYLNGASQPVPPEEILICDLSEWASPPASKSYSDGQGNAVERTITVGVDPELGRLAFPRDRALPASVHVSWFQGFSSELGGGFYDRQDTLGPDADYRVSSAQGHFPGLAQALEQWADDSGQPPEQGPLSERSAVIELMDSELHAAGTLSVPEGFRLEIRGANVQRPLVTAPDGVWRITLGPRAELTLSGLLVGCGLEVTPQEGASLRLVHSTLVPGRGLSPGGEPLEKAPSVTVLGEPAGFTLSMTRSISGSLRLRTSSSVRLEDSIVDGLGGEAIGAQGDGSPAGNLTVLGSTVLGTVAADVLELASDSLFTGAVTVVQRQRGGVRFSYLPAGSQTPRRFRCQPDFPSGSTPPQQAQLERRIRPLFTSVRYGAPGYCQLRPETPGEIRREASDEGEMGVFHHLQQSAREMNLRGSLAEYVRFGHEAGIFFVT